MPARASLVRLIGLLSVFSCYADPLFADPVVYSATDFGDALWDTTVIYESGVTGSVSGWHVETGGHTGAFRQCRVTLDAGGPGAVWGFHRCIPFTFSPQTQGAIDWIDHSEYAISIDPPGYGHNTGPAIRQEGVVYVVSGLFTYETSWTYKSLTNLVASDFYVVGSPSSAHPDFSANGSPFEIGFVTGHSTKISQHGSRDVDVGIDNWTFVVNPVPEPFSLAFLGSAFVGVLAYRLRRGATGREVALCPRRPAERSGSPRLRYRRVGS